jgi:sugar phosphate isomerase/epimerase
VAAPPLALAPLGFLELDPPTLVAVAGAAGLSAVGLRVAPAVPGGVHYPLRTGSRELAETLERMGERGVGVLQVELVELERATDVAALRPLLETGAALGAGRVVATGDDGDAVVAQRLAELADLAAEHRMAVDLEFMRFRRVGTLGQALRIVEAAGRDNVAVMVDALHLVRSGGGPADLAAADPRRLAVLQLCDAPAAAPGDDVLVHEAREARLLPGQGDLPLAEMIDAMPEGAHLAVEIPTVAGAALSPVARARAGHAAAVRALVQSRSLGA